MKEKNTQTTTDRINTGSEWQKIKHPTSSTSAHESANENSREKIQNRMADQCARRSQQQGTTRPSSDSTSSESNDTFNMAGSYNSNSAGQIQTDTNAENRTQGNNTDANFHADRYGQSIPRSHHQAYFSSRKWSEASRRSSYARSAPDRTPANERNKENDPNRPPTVWDRPVGTEPGSSGPIDSDQASSTQNIAFRSGHNRYFLADKTHYMSMRYGLGFRFASESFHPDGSYQQMMMIANHGNHNFISPDAAYAQSRLFKQNIEGGMSESEAYEKARLTYIDMTAQGHTSESIVASLSEKYTQEDIDFLKVNGESALYKRRAFAYGQRGGHSARTGDFANIEAQILAERLLKEGADRPVSDWEDLGIIDHALYQPSGISIVAGRTVKNLAAGVSDMGVSMFYSAANESSLGVRKTEFYAKFAYLSIGMTIINRARHAINTPLAFELRSLLHYKGFTDVAQYRASLDKQMERLGLKSYPRVLKGVSLARASKAQMVAIKAQMKIKGATPALKEAYRIAKEYHKLGTLTAFARTPRRMRIGRRVIRLSAMGYSVLLMSSRGTDSFRGISMASRYSRIAISASKAFLWAGRKGLSAGSFAVGGMFNSSGRIASKTGKALTEAAEKKGIQYGVKLGRGLQKYGSGIEKAAMAKRGAAKKVSHIRKKTKGFFNDPFGIKAKTRRQIDRLMRRALLKLSSKFKKGTKVAKGISKVVSVIVHMVSAMINMILFLAGGGFIFIIAILIIVIVLILLSGIFNFAGQEETLQDIVVGTIEDCYEEDIMRIFSLAENYTTSTINYDDMYKDYEMYETYKSDAEAASFTQSTNCAEIIAMTMVRFDYDLTYLEYDNMSSSEKKEIQDYIKDLYYGSHEIYVKESSTTRQVFTGEYDDEGNAIYTEVVQTNAIITYRTYYFEYMFDETIVPLNRSSTPTVYNNGLGNFNGHAYGSINSWDTLYAALRDMGFSHNAVCGILGCLTIESGGTGSNPTEAIIRANFLNPTAVNPTDGGYGIAQWTDTNGYPRKQNLINWCIENNYDYTTMAGQLAFMYHELTEIDYYKRAYDLLSDSSLSAEDCGAIFGIYYEGCGTDVQRLSVRMRSAAVFDSMYRDVEDYSTLLPTGGATGTFIWPTSGGYISSHFGGRQSPTAGASSNHKGIDIAVGAGTPIYAADGGVVTEAAYNNIRGYYIVVDHGNGMSTLYQHCSAVYGAVGDTVSQGDVIAAVGSSGISTGAHLHFEVWVNGTPVNPEDYIVIS